MNYSITVKYGCTQNVGDYSNVRPELELMVSGDGSEQDMFNLMDNIFQGLKRRIHDAADSELEYHDRDVIYTDETLYTLLNPHDFDFVAVVPSHEPLPELWRQASVQGFQRLRYDNLVRKLKKRPDICDSVDDIAFLSTDELPELQHFTFLLLKHPEAQYLLIVSGRYHEYYTYGSDKTPVPRRWYDLSNRKHSVVMPRDEFKFQMTTLATDNRVTLIDCLNGDFSILPELPPEPKREGSDIPFDRDEDEDEYDDHDDE